MLDKTNRKYHVNVKQISSPEPLVYCAGRTLQRRKNVSILHIISFISTEM